MNYLFTILSVVPYFCYIYLLIKEELLNKDLTFRNLFRFDTLILIAIFIYFSTFKTVFVNKMLFFTFNLYLLVNKLYDKNIKGKMNFKKDILKIIFVYIISVLPFLPYIINRKLALSYYLAFAFIIFIHQIILISKKLFK